MSSLDDVDYTNTPAYIAAFEAIALALYGDAGEAYKPCVCNGWLHGCEDCNGAGSTLLTPDELVAKAKADGRKVREIRAIAALYAEHPTATASVAKEIVSLADTGETLETNRRLAARGQE